MKRYQAPILGAAALALLAGCASAPMMGAQPADTPPRLVPTDKKDPATGKLLLDWDQPGAFGKVSGPLKALGDGACMSARVDLEALGYHPKARDEKGETMNGGGFYCYPRANGEKPDATPPRLGYDDAADGRRLLTWDRPGAFGKVPEELQVRGDVACMLAAIHLEAIATPELVAAFVDDQADAVRLDRVGRAAQDDRVARLERERGRVDREGVRHHRCRAQRAAPANGYSSPGRRASRGTPASPRACPRSRPRARSPAGRWRLSRRAHGRGCGRHRRRSDHLHPAREGDRAAPPAGFPPPAPHSPRCW